MSIDGMKYGQGNCRCEDPGEQMAPGMKKEGQNKSEAEMAFNMAANINSRLSLVIGKLQERLDPFLLQDHPYEPKDQAKKSLESIYFNQFYEVLWAIHDEVNRINHIIQRLAL